MLDFQPVTMGLKTLVESYTLKYDEGFCQLSFVLLRSDYDGERE